MSERVGSGGGGGGRVAYVCIHTCVDMYVCVCVFVRMYTCMSDHI